MSACESSAHRAFRFEHPCGGTCSRPGGLWLIRERNYNETGGRLDEARVVVLNIADADDHRPADHLIGRAGGEQRLELGHVGRMFADPHRPCLGLQNHGRQVMLFGAQFVRNGGDDGEAANSFARRLAPGSHNPAMPISRRLASAIA